MVREGRDVTLITYSAGVSQGVEVADELDKDGISVEVIDIRTLVPLDVETIVNSVQKTSRAVVLHEAAKRMGYGAEIAATIQEEAFWHLDQPVVRIAAKNTPDRDQPAAGGRDDPAAGGDRGDAARRWRRQHEPTSTSSSSAAAPAATRPRCTRHRPGRRWRWSRSGQVGGTCLHRGCIPAKALLHAAEVFRTVGHAADFGISSR